MNPLDRVLVPVELPIKDHEDYTHFATHDGLDYVRLPNGTIRRLLMKAKGKSTRRQWKKAKQALRERHAHQT